MCLKTIIDHKVKQNIPSKVPCNLGQIKGFFLILKVKQVPILKGKMKLFLYLFMEVIIVSMLLRVSSILRTNVCSFFQRLCSCDSDVNRSCPPQLLITRGTASDKINKQLLANIVVQLLFILITALSILHNLTLTLGDQVVYSTQVVMYIAKKRRNLLHGSGTNLLYVEVAWAILLMKENLNRFVCWNSFPRTDTFYC